jgi:hypothetical protein
LFGCLLICLSPARRRLQPASPPPARRRLQPASEIKAKLQLCSLGYAGRKIPSGENQNRYLMLFDDRHGLPALQAGAKLELCFYVRRRLEPAPSGGEFRSPHFFNGNFFE